MKEVFLMDTSSLKLSLVEAIHHPFLLLLLIPFCLISNEMLQRSVFPVVICLLRAKITTFVCYFLFPG